MIKSFKQYQESLYVDKKGNLVSDEKDQKTYVHTPDADAKMMHIQQMYNDPTFERNLFEHLLNRKFDVSIVDEDAYNSLSMAIRDGIIDEKDLSTILEFVNSKDLDTRTDSYIKLIQLLYDLKDQRNYNFDLLKRNISKLYNINLDGPFLDVMQHALEQGKLDILDLRNLCNMSESPMYYNTNESKFPKQSEYDNLSDDVEVYAKDKGEVKKLNMEEYEVVKVVDVILPHEVEKIQEMQVLNLGTTMPKDIKRGDEMYLTVMLQPKSKVSSYNPTNLMGCVRVRVVDIYQGLSILKSKGLLK